MINESSIGSTASGYGLDTALVLFFLTIEFGRGVQFFTIDGALMSMTMAMLVVLPYFLPAAEGPSFGRWLAVRSVVATLGITLGLASGQSAGAVVGNIASLLPMTFLILTGMVSCYIRFYSLLKLRLAK